MTVNDYINKNYYHLKNEMYNITNGENNDLFDDFYHDCLEIFLRHEKAQQVVDNGSAKYFLVRIGLNQWRSKTSTFHYQYRLHMIDLTEDIDLPYEAYDVSADIMMDVMMSGLDRMYKLDEKSRYRAMMIIIYHSLGSNFSEVERQFEIPRTTVREIYNAGKEQLKQIITQLLKDLDNGDFKLNRDITQLNADWCDLFGSDTEQTVSMASRLFQSKYFDIA